MRVLGIAGVGLIGGSVGMAARQSGFAERVIGIGRNPERLEKALAVGAIDSYTTDLAEGAAASDLLYLAAPISVIIRQIGELSALASSGLVVTDGGSTKGAIMQAARKLPQQISFVGGHPMAGSEESGVQAASPTLFQGATYIICSETSTSGEAVNLVRSLAAACGANVVEMDAVTHDAVVARTSHLPHILAGALLRSAATIGDDAREAAAGSFRDLTRVADSPPEIWRDICSTNSDSIRQGLSEMIALLQEFGLALDSTDDIERWFEESRALRAGFPAKGADK